MKKGDTIVGYRIVTDPTNANGGKCIWAFAEKDGAKYFIKQFLEPKRPRDDARESPSLQIRRRLAQEFEERHHTIMKRLRPDARGGGNIVLATDFFHEGSTYYKVTERIDTSSLEKPQILEPRQKTVLLKTLGNSLKQLHDIDVVHGDLKPLNVLVQKRDGAAFHAAKLIDFDDSYVSGRPPEPEDISGDSLYGAPEWRRYLQHNAGPEQLTCAVDIFALGLMTHLYLVGELPYYDGRFGSPADAVNAGDELALSTRLSDQMLGLLRRMTAGDASTRPRISAFLAALSDPKVCALQHRRPGTTKPKAASTAKDEPTPTAASGRTSRIRTNPSSGMTPGPSSSPPRAADSTAPVSAPEPSGEAPGPRPSRVRINLGDRGRRSP
ncbi:protein kinase domain-containing protein [Streptomyces sp. NBC_00212]|uniref:protein kinase domain-containing protein n=1 Tax=Streptomyces sp. NBC_00212 TaxID=2975684 RepID=UPI003249C682